jgi:hypothetical protein
MHHWSSSPVAAGTDVLLPAPSGRDLARKAHELRAGLPVSFTSGYARNAIIHHGRIDPDVQLLGKPYMQQSLAQRLRELLDMKSAAGVLPPTDTTNRYWPGIMLKTRPNAVSVPPVLVNIRLNRHAGTRPICAPLPDRAYGYMTLAIR